MIPGSNLSGSVSINIKGMVNGKYAQPSNDFIIYVWRSSTNLDKYTIAHPKLTLLQRNPLNSAASTLAISPTQTGALFLRNY